MLQWKASPWYLTALRKVTSSLHTHICLGQCIAANCYAGYIKNCNSCLHFTPISSLQHIPYYARVIMWLWPASRLHLRLSVFLSVSFAAGQVSSIFYMHAFVRRLYLKLSIFISPSFAPALLSIIFYICMPL